MTPARMTCVHVSGAGSDDLVRKWSPDQRRPPNSDMAHLTYVEAPAVLCVRPLERGLERHQLFFVETVVLRWWSVVHGYCGGLDGIFSERHPGVELCVVTRARMCW